MIKFYKKFLQKDLNGQYLKRINDMHFKNKFNNNLNRINHNNIYKNGIWGFRFNNKGQFLKYNEQKIFKNSIPTKAANHKVFILNLFDTNENKKYMFIFSLTHKDDDNSGRNIIEPNELNRTSSVHPNVFWSNLSDDKEISNIIDLINIDNDIVKDKLSIENLKYQILKNGDQFKFIKLENNNINENFNYVSFSELKIKISSNFNNIEDIPVIDSMNFLKYIKSIFSEGDDNG